MWPGVSLVSLGISLLQNRSALSSATTIGDLNELLVRPRCTSLVTDDF